MPTQQEIIQKNLPQIENWIKEYLPSKQQQDNELVKLKDQIIHFTVRLPLIGAFSAGKSTVLNALIGKKMLATNITATTSIPTELFYCEQPSIMINFGDGKTEEIDKKQLKDQKYLEKFAKKGAWIEVGIDQEHWASFSHLCVVDFPGLDSGNEIHNLAIDKYLEKSLAYAVVVSVKDGNIVETSRKFLEDLSIENKPVIIILTKTDQLDTKDRKAVIDKILQEVEKILQVDPIATIIPDVDNPNETQKQFLSILEEIEREQIEPIFRHHIGIPVINFLKYLKKNGIDILLNNENYDPKKIEEKIELSQQQTNKFIADSQYEKNKFENELSGIAIYIREDIEAKLHENTKRLTEMVLDERSVDGAIEDLVRTQLKKSIAERYNPLVRNYIQGMSKNIPTDIKISSPNISRPTQSIASSSGTSFSGSDWAASIGAAIPVLSRVIPAMGKFLGPVGMIISSAVPLVGKLIDGLLGNNDAEKRAQAYNEAYQKLHRQFVNDIIPKIGREVGNEVEKLFANSAEELFKEFDAMVASQMQTREEALQKLKKELEEKKEELKAKREKYSKDSQDVAQLIEMLENA